MQYFIVFVVGAMLLGAGAMLSPAWPTRQPRIGTSAVFVLALIVGGAVFWAELFGWDTLVIDYLLFALVSVVVLGGTFSQAQERAEEQGEELLDADQGWPGPEDLVFFGVAALVCVAPLSLFYLPGGTLAIEHAAITLSARDGGTFTTLAPYFPDVTVQSAPGFHALTAYLSQQLRQAIPVVHLAVSSVLVLLAIWASYDLGAELRDKRLGRAMALAATVAGWWALAFTAGQFAWLIAIVFGLAYLLYLLRYQQNPTWFDMVGAGLMLGAAFYTHVGVFVGLLVGGILLLAVVGQASERPPERTKIISGILFGVPGVALLGTAPWWVSNLADVQQMIQQTIITEAIWSAPLPVLLGAMAGVVGLAQSDNRHLILWLVFWLGAAQILELGSAVIVLPVLILSGNGLLWLYEQVPQQGRDLSRRFVYSLMSLAVIVVIGGTGFISQQTQSALFGGATADDAAVLREFALYAPDEARLFNPPDSPWALPLAERPVSYFNLPDAQLLHNLPDSTQLPDAATHYYQPDGTFAPDTLALEAAFTAGDARIYAIMTDDDPE